MGIADGGYRVRTAKTAAQGYPAGPDSRLCLCRCDQLRALGAVDYRYPDHRYFQPGSGGAGYCRVPVPGHGDLPDRHQPGAHRHRATGVHPFLRRPGLRAARGSDPAQLWRRHPAGHGDCRGAVVTGGDVPVPGTEHSVPGADGGQLCGAVQYLDRHRISVRHEAIQGDIAAVCPGLRDYCGGGFVAALSRSGRAVTRVSVGAGDLAGRHAGIDRARLPGAQHGVLRDVRPSLSVPQPDAGRTVL